MQDHLPKGGTTHHGPGHYISTSNQENASCPCVMETIPQLKFPFSRDSSLCQADKRCCQPIPTRRNTRLQPQALAFVAVEPYVSFPGFCLANTCMPFKTSLPWNASPVLVTVIAATTFLGTPPAQQLPLCANSLFVFCLSHQTLSP